MVICDAILRGVFVKRIIVALLLTLFLTGCKGKPYEIGLCMHDDTVFTRAYAQVLQQALEQQGCRVTRLHSHNDQSAQNRQLDKLIAQGCDGLIISPVMTSAADELVQRVKEADIPAVLVSREPEEAVLDLWERVSYVGCDPAGAGQAQAQLLLKTKDKGDVNGDGVLTYVVLQGQQRDLDARDRTDCALRSLWDAGVITYELKLYCTDGQKETARQACAKALTAFGDDVEAVLCNTDTMALGAMEALGENGRVVGRDVYLLGMDAVPQALEQVAAGKLTGTVLEDYQSQAQQATHTLIRLLSGQSVQKRCYVDHILVTAENAAQYSDWWK